MSQREKRKTSTIQVSPELNLVLTKYATEQGITKAEAADRVFNILYPKGVETQPLAPPAEGAEEGTEGPPMGIEFGEEGEDMSKELVGTVKDLRAVHTIKALTSGLNEKGNGDDKITTREAFELKKIETMFGGSRAAQGTDALDAAFQKYIVPLQNQVNQLQTEVQNRRVADTERERDEYKRRLDEKEQREERAQETMAIVSPIQEQFAELSNRVTSLAESLKLGSKEKPTREEASDEVKAINNLAVEIRNAVQRLGAGGGGAGGGGESLTDTIDTLTTLIDKLNEVSTKLRGGGEGGDFDWRAAGISSISEVAQEAFKTWRAIHGTGGEEDEESSGEGKKEQLSQQVILRRVYNYAVKKIAEGELQLNPHEAAGKLGLSPNQVWWAVETLRKRGMLKTGTTTEGSSGEAGTGELNTEELRSKGLLDV